MRLSGVKVLVVDDNPDCLEGAAEWLQMEGALVLTAASGNQGFATFVREPPHIILSDICMPDGDGYDLIARVRQLTPNNGGLTPAIAMSCAGNRERALRAGFQVFVAKPFDLLSVIEMITELATKTPSPASPAILPPP